MKRARTLFLVASILLTLCSCGKTAGSVDAVEEQMGLSGTVFEEQISDPSLSEAQKKKYARYDNKAPSGHSDSIDHNEFRATEVAFPRIETEFDHEIQKKVADRKQTIRDTKTEIEIKGTAYYISSDGNDANSGLSPASPWKTISKLNAATFHSGDAVLFKRGETWRGECLELKAGVTYSAYGEGCKPAIYGSPENGTGAEKWRLLEGTDNIWVFYQDVLECGTIVLDESRWMTKVNPYIKDGEFLLPDASMRPFDVREALDEDLSFYSEDDTFVVYHNAFEGPRHPGKVYVRCDAGNPGELYSSIEFCPWTNTDGGKGLLYVRDPEEIGVIRDPIMVDNLTIKYTGGYGIYLCGTSITVQNCEIGWIGGCTLWYFDFDKFGGSGNCVGNYGDVDGYEVLNCYLYQAYDSGISSEETFKTGCQKNMVFAGNVIEDCLFGIEFLAGDNMDMPVSLEQVRVSDNYIIDSGYGFGSKRQYRPWNVHDVSVMLHPYYVDINDVLLNDNVLYKSGNYLVSCGAEKKPEFSGNTYVQDDLGGLCLWSTGTGSARGLDEYLFNSKAETVIRDKIGDTTAIVPKLSY